MFLVISCKSTAHRACGVHHVQFCFVFPFLFAFLIIVIKLDKLNFLKKSCLQNVAFELNAPTPAVGSLTVSDWRQCSECVFVMPKEALTHLAFRTRHICLLNLILSFHNASVVHNKYTFKRSTIYNYLCENVFLC